MRHLNIVKLLVVDDKPENLKLIPSFFEDSTYFILTTSSAEEVIEACNDIEFDLILLDIRMPVDGFKVFNFIKSSSKNFSTPVIFMAEVTDVENITKAFKMGCRDVITKPFKLEEFISKVSVHSMQQMQHKQINELILAKEKIFSIIGHDLRSPFNSLIGYSSLILDNLRGTDNIEALKYAEVINRISVKNLELLDSLLVYAKNLQKDSLEAFTVVNINDLISEVLQVAQPAALLKNIKLIKIFGELAETFGIRDLIATIVRNIVSNAIKYTNKDGCVTVQTNLAGDMVEIIISDNGVGMNEATVKNLFDSNQVESLRGTAGEIGSGFGLLLTKEIVDKHQGRISIDSSVGVGTTFVISLPRYIKR
jgi:two-component system sensor histidine kinase/response regulator